MNTAKVFTNGRSQAIRLPKEYRVQDTEVYVKKYEDIVMLIPKKSVWNTMLSGINNFSDDFMDNREQPELPNRDGIQ